MVDDSLLSSAASLVRNQRLAYKLVDRILGVVFVDDPRTISIKDSLEWFLMLCHFSVTATLNIAAALPIAT